MLFAGFKELVYVQVVVGWLPVLLVLRLVEPPGERLSSEGHVDNMRMILGYLVNHSNVLRLVVLALSIWSLTTFYAVWLLQKLWELQGIDLAHFGWLWGGLTLIAAVAGRWAHRRITSYNVCYTKLLRPRVGGLLMSPARLLSSTRR